MNRARLIPGTGVLTLVGLLSAAPAAAQPLSVRGYVTYGSTVFASSESFEAITGETSKAGIGGGATVIGLWRGLFADVGVSQQELDGQRVFIDAGVVYPLGIPVTITMRPVDIAGGWRFFYGRLSPYAGAGVSLLSYEETADFAESGDNVSESKTGALFLAGVDVAVIRWLHAGAEFRYRAVKGVLGDGGVSDIYGDDQLGGYAFAVRISVGR
jgi:hypothetical protein